MKWYLHTAILGKRTLTFDYSLLYFHPYAVGTRNQFILPVSTLLMVFEMFIGHFNHVAMDLLFISVFARLLALFLE